MTLLPAIKEAIDMEFKGEVAYREFAQNTSDPFIKQTFTGLADDEVEHGKILRRMAENIEDSENLSLDMIKLKDNNPQRILGMDISAFKEHAKVAEAELEPFDAGIALEKAGIEHYTKAHDAAETEEQKGFFHSLIEQEKMHLAALEKAKSFLRHPEQEFQEMEEWLLDGGV